MISPFNDEAAALHTISENAAALAAVVVEPMLGSGGCIPGDPAFLAEVFDAARKTVRLNELDWSSHLVTGEGHPLINSEWGAWLDHLKGGRKDLGKSKRTDLLVKRSEPYWQQFS